MFRRCVAIFVLVGFAAGQLASIPHSHASLSSNDHRQHDAIPHIHPGWHDHGHSHADRQHSHEHEAVHLATTSSGTSQTDIAGNCDGHDSGVLYLPGTFSLVTRGAERFANQAPAPALVTELASAWSHHELVRAIALRDPPDFHASGGKLYLKLRQLRI